MFATMRRKNRNAKMKSELGQSVDHFKRAASLAAQETSATVGPKFAAAKDRVQPAARKAKGAATSGWGSAIATLGPLVAAASENARQTGKKANKRAVKANKDAAKAGRRNARKLEKRANKAVGRKQSSTGGKLVKLALAGAAVGAAGAYVLRKRRSDQWDEYDPTGPVNRSTLTTGAEDAAFEPADLSGPSGFVTPAGSTGPVVGGTGSDPALKAGAEPALLPEGDQTTSALHSPEVARMANGKNKS
ncbi:hypothetical protein Asp14428_48400 [Actinoplanes sp. NBRC 14428]|uniref:Uncharacterized protein n=2 Tax=Pseudosporangium ferrugineum TaxID=439699 RepID=A0A2T0S1L6_9ACTN|nr:hypothetical protein CLV70_111271 [Pseudosporangium ferrugineum]BCJ53365.1 hypothetical protein Asp14428_48400 [Actinoplanes sp. NBRC 14428]